MLAGVLGRLFVLPTPVAATITPTGTALTIAQAIASASATVTGAFETLPPSGTPNGVSTSPIGGFPIDGADYGILTTGNVSNVDQIGTFASTRSRSRTVPRAIPPAPGGATAARSTGAALLSPPGRQ